MTPPRPDWWPHQETRDGWAELFAYMTGGTAQPAQVLAACILVRRPSPETLRMLAECFREADGVMVAPNWLQQGLGRIARVLDVAADHAEAEARR